MILSGIKTQALTKSMYMGIWETGAWNQLFIILILKLNFENKVVSSKTAFFVTATIYNFCLFDESPSLNRCVFIIKTQWIMKP